MTAIFTCLILPSYLLLIQLAFAASSEGANLLANTSDDHGNNNEESHSNRELTWGPWRPACKARCQTLTRDLYRDTCYKLCDGRQYATDNTYSTKKECKAHCRATKRENLQKCVSAYCSEDPTRDPTPYTPEEDELCSKCPCCDSDPSFKWAALRPVLCFYRNFDSGRVHRYEATTCDGGYATIKSTDRFGASNTQLECGRANNTILQPFDVEVSGAQAQFDACEALFNKNKCLASPQDTGSSFREAIEGHCENFLIQFYSAFSREQNTGP
mmetsp:Transcript_31560/g.46826  ORF Transcript_31560/g.46826 Transcript_31560/m.46826 type:complete len:271 (-) Transcript_31560:152-964(-)